MLTEAEITGIVHAVRRVAATEITPHFRSLDPDDIDSKSAPDDLVTKADKAAEKALTLRLKSVLPDAAIVGEEAISADKTLLDRIGRGGRCVIIDPIDGTWNYAHGSATYGVIIAVIEDGETIFGMLYDPSFDDWIVARKGHGAIFSGAARTPRTLTLQPPSTSLDEVFGFVGLYLFHGAHREKIAQTLPQFRRTLTLRCSCHEYRMLSTGASSFGLNGLLNAWDHAAGVLIYQEAGGFSRLLDGQDYAPTMTEGHLLNAASEALWEKLAPMFAA